MAESDSFMVLPLYRSFQGRQVDRFTSSACRVEATELESAPACR